MEKDCILVLDIDGTLTDSVAMHQEALLGAMQALRLTRLNTDWGSYPHHTDTGIFAHAIAQNGIEAPTSDTMTGFERDLDNRFSIQLAEHGLHEVSGARALVLAAAQSRWGVVFATGGIRSVSRRKLRAVGIDFAEEVLITSSEHASRRNLVAAAVNRAMHVYDIPSPQAVTSIGDGLWDLRVAAELGLGFVGIGSSDSLSGRALRAQGAVVFSNLHEFIPHLVSPDIHLSPQQFARGDPRLPLAV
ncbi:MAG TPA: HAD family hydrolase [Trinickia sp.]|nr:HAD family hydrolase [Trinickia sp.]